MAHDDAHPAPRPWRSASPDPGPSGDPTRSRIARRRRPASRSRCLPLGAGRLFRPERVRRRGRAVPRRPRSARATTASACTCGSFSPVRGRVAAPSAAPARRLRPVATSPSRRLEQGVWRFRFEAFADDFATWAARRRRSRSPPASTPRSCATLGARLLDRAAAEKIAGRLPSDGALESAAASLRDRERSTTTALEIVRRPRDRRVLRATAAHVARDRRRRAPSCSSSASAPASAPGTSSSRAPRAPSAEGRHDQERHLPHGGQAAARRRGDGLRRPLPAADPSRSARTNRKGPNNTLDPRARRPGVARGRSAAAEGGHDAIHPDLGTLADFRAFVAGRARTRASRSPSTSRCSPRPITRGSPSIRSGSPRCPTARSPTPRTRRRSTRTSTRSTSTTTRRASAPRCCASCGTGSLRA